MATFGVPPSLPQQKKPRGCFFYGCITALVLGIVLGVGGFFVIRYGLDKLVEFVEPYTETAPMALPQSTLPPAEYQLLEQRVREFGTAAEAGEKPAPLILTSDDLNALIANHPSWRLIRGKVYVSMQDDQITGDIALPLDDLIEHMPGMSRLKGRFLNGTATLRVVLVDEILVVSLRSLKIKGEDLPSELMEELRSRNLVDKSQADALTKKVESIEVKDGKLTIKAKPGK